MAAVLHSSTKSLGLVVRRLGKDSAREFNHPYANYDEDAFGGSSDSFMTTSEIDKPSRRNEQAFDDGIIEEFPPDHSWMQDLERQPNSALNRTFKFGEVQQTLDQKAPQARIGITYMAGSDMATVTDAEQKAMNRDGREPDQQTPEWRVYTGGSVTIDYNVGADLRRFKIDCSNEIVKRIRSGRVSPPVEDSKKTQKLQKTATARQPSTELAERNKSHHNLNICSNDVKLFHGLPPRDQGFDKVATLVEVDMLSMRNLLHNYTFMISMKGKKLSLKETTALLDTMINDVRLLCTRSPRLFRILTRAVIARSSDVRYGVDFDNKFVTITTSEGIRQFLEKGSAYYLSLDQFTEADKSSIKPRFLQMLVLLLSLLNDKDLAVIQSVLEGTYHLPGDRKHVEALIMKVLPLQAISADLFLQGVFEAYKPDDVKQHYTIRQQEVFWQEIMRDIARRGFLVPSLSRSSRKKDGIPQEASDLANGFSDDSDVEDDGLVNMMDANNRSKPEMTWIPMPLEGLSGLKTSAVFKYLQHDCKLRKNGEFASGDIHSINDVLHLDTTVDGREDKENRVVVTLQNRLRYKVHPKDAENISAMSQGTYTLEPLEPSHSIAKLEIIPEVLNDSFRNATDRLNQLLKIIRQALETRGERFWESLSLGSKNATQLADINTPSEATRVRAELTETQDHQSTTVAVAFKIANRIVLRHNVLREMQTNLDRLKYVNKWVRDRERTLSGVRARNSAEQSAVNDTIKKCKQYLDEIKTWLKESETTWDRLRAQESTTINDPIKEVSTSIFAEDFQAPLPYWQDYESALDDKTQKYLNIIGRKFVVKTAAVSNAPSGRFEAELKGVPGVKLFLESLSFAGIRDVNVRLRPDSTVAWLGHYLVLLQQAHAVKHGFTVEGYLRVIGIQLSSDLSLQDLMDGVQMSKIRFV